MSPNAVAPKSSFRYPLETLQQVLADETCPCAFLDLETFDENLDFLGRELEKIGRDVKIRIGTKSLRVPTLINRALQRSYCVGVLLFNAGEIQFLQENYGVTDFLLAYPVLGRRETDLLAAGAQRDPAAVITAMVDCPTHLELLEQSAAAIDVTLSVCIDVDMGISFLKQLAGVMRTPLQTPEQVVNLARQLEHFPHLKFRGIMGYEAQEASIGDSSYIMRQMKKASRGLVPQKRAAAVQALADAGFKTEIVNGGGSGCFQLTAQESTITEIGLGSALYKSSLFDGFTSMQGFRPSLFMALRVVRQPRPNIVTAFSGGYVCSGSKKSPIVVLPPGCKATAREDFGEVQTPILFDPRKTHLKPGDLVVCRLAKAGEPLERFNDVIAISGGTIIDRFPTYRGLGLCLG